MLHLSKITALLISLLLLPRHMSALCNKCNSNSYIACHNGTTFSICINGEPTLTYIECPKNHHCTIDKFICYRKKDSNSACPETNLLPSLDVPTSVSSTTPEPSTTKAPRDPLTICKEARKNGRHINEMDLTCTTYILCYPDSTTNSWSATVLTCQNKWFDGQFCTSEKPNYCL